MKTVALVTYQASPQLSTSDQALVAPLRERGLEAVAAPWDDPVIDWTRFDAVVLRSCWDYHTRPEAFRQWIARLNNQNVRLYNAATTIFWNMEKTYQRKLAEQGIKTLPTVWASYDAEVTLVDVLSSQGWGEAVVKPAIGASAYGIQVISATNAEQTQPLFEKQLAHGTMMIQPVIKEIYEGELSLVFFLDEFSHAILKRPGQGTLFVNSGHGGTSTLFEPSAKVIDAARHILKTAQHLIGDTLTLYARVDGVMIEGEFVLMELELIEPGLFLDQAAPYAGERFAQAIERSVSGDR